MRKLFIFLVFLGLFPACDKDPGTKQEAQPQAIGQFITSGGGELTSDHYRLKLSVAPVQPVGTVTGNRYQLKLGPVAQEK
jgi:hypothetical protein